MSDLKVLHIENPAGVASSLRAGQRKLGMTSDVLVTWPNSMSFPIDFDMQFKGASVSTFSTMRNIVKMANGYDVLHVHSGINWKRADLLWLGYILRKPILLHYHGSETRMGYGSYFSSLARAKVVSTPDLLEWWNDATYIPNPADEDLLLRPLTPPGAKIRVLHMPTDRRIKGTDKVLEAMEILRSEGIDFDFRLAEGISHPNAVEEMEMADIVIDWISDRNVTGIAGIYGKTSIEAMALGKVAIAFIEPDLRGKYPEGLPVVSPTEPSSTSLADSMRELLSDRTLLVKHMLEGRSYVQNEHGQEAIARRFQQIYENII